MKANRAEETKAMFDLTGRVAMVTGGGRGIGAGVAKSLARQGAAIVVNDFVAGSAEAIVLEIESAGGRAFAAPFDVTDYDACCAGARDAEEALGPIDILVNNAGGSPGGMWPMSFLETPREKWAEFIDMNLYGVLNCTRTVIGGMADRGWGRIVTVSSDAARAGSEGSSIYGAAKAGGEGLMRTLSKEYGPKGVTANAVVLGLIDTVPKEFLEGRDVGSAYVMRRIGTTEDVAAGVVYLVSEEAGWVSGHSLVINGGGTGF
jgi:NAD(P)-dependent dehydrogenase (short-subunit alcohol dehydrogenase family)